MSTERRGDHESAVGRRVVRLLRLYPRSWRVRYGAEFSELLTEQLKAREQSARDTFDVVREALCQRIRCVWSPDAAGAVHDPCAQDSDKRRGTALLYGPSIVFLGLGAGMWSQLRNGLHEAASLGKPVPEALSVSTTVLSVSAVAALTVCVTAAGAGALGLVRRASSERRQEAPRLSGPLLALFCGLAMLSGAGWSADRSAWFTPAASSLPRSGPLHFATLWIRGLVAPITPAWVHPSTLWHLPGGDLLAVLIAPLGGLLAAAGLLLLARRSATAPTDARSTAVSGFIARAVVGTMTIFAISCAAWVVSLPSARGAWSTTRVRELVAPGHTGVAVIVLMLGLTAISAKGAMKITRSRSAVGLR